MEVAREGRERVGIDNRRTYHNCNLSLYSMPERLYDSPVPDTVLRVRPCVSN